MEDKCVGILESSWNIPELVSTLVFFFHRENAPQGEVFVYCIYSTGESLWEPQEWRKGAALNTGSPPSHLPQR